mmetsp:Transcript_28517/g.64337  ORF Transcript_28517/g.64337 Transcript_28517/m.64337 type:complete len:295 (-) Transcript_28517:377-1261(-)
MMRCGFTSASSCFVSASMSKSTASGPSSCSFGSPVQTRHLVSLFPSNILLDEEMTLTQTPKLSLSFRFCLWESIWRIRAEPILPVPPRTATLTIVCERVKAMWAALRARDASWFETTTATWRSDEPWAMTRMFTLALARELINVAETPLCMAMPSPTIATIAIDSSETLIELTFDLDSSSSNVDLSAFRAERPWFSGTTTVMLDSELACVTMSTSMEASAIAPMNRSATSAPPMTLAPSSVTNDTPSTLVMPLMGTMPVLLRQLTTLPSIVSPRLEHRPWMTVPLKDGLKMFRT